MDRAQSTEPVGKADTDTVQTEQVEQTEQQPETEAVEAVDEPEPSDSPAFDNSWASNDFEMQLPEPSFEEWRITEQTESLWRLESITAHYDETLIYVNALRNAGFSVNEKEQDFDKLGYIFEADNAAGYHIDLTYQGNEQGNGRVALDLTREASAVQPSAPENGSNELPELPAAEWDSDIFEDDTTSWTTYFARDLELEEVLNYVEQLRAAGYDLGEEEYPDGNAVSDIYAYYAMGDTDETVEVDVYTEGQHTVTTIRIGIPK